MKRSTMGKPHGVQRERFRGRRLRFLMAMKPTTPDALHGFVRRGLGLDVGRTAVSRGSTPPFDYLCHTFFDGGDCVVWANRGGGKTMLGAVATLLDLLFKPGVQVRILGGSLEQSSKMYEHLRTLLERPLLAEWPGSGGLLAGPATARRVALVNGSRVEILAGSQRSVRGTRVHKLRCDEVEEFQPTVWEAAQLVTRSGRCGDAMVRGSVEGLSTMHRPFGLMSKLVAPDTFLEEQGGTVSSGPPVFKWNALDVVARCPPALDCETCLLWDDCGGRAKQATGFVPVEDLIDQHRRTSDLTWSAEMMCERPGVASSVYPSFDPRESGPHVRLLPDGAATANTTTVGTDAVRWVGGMDFGLRSPHVMLWAQVSEQRAGQPAHAAQVHVVGEYIVNGQTLDRHVEAIAAQAQAHGWPSADQLAWVGVDPAGNQRNAHSGRTDVALLRDAGYRVRSAGSRIHQGIEMVRRRLDRHTLSIHPRCTRLIKALQAYHFDPEDPMREEPVKDGPDHACDALRYLLVNLERGGGRAVAGNYLGLK